MKRLVIVNQFAGTPRYSSGAGERHYYLAPLLTNGGYSVEIFSGSYNHLFIEYPETSGSVTVEQIPGGSFNWIKLRKYNGESFIARVLSWFEFVAKLFFFTRQKDKQKPSAVVVSSMSLISAFYGIYLKRKYKIPFILEIRDIWPLTPVSLGNYSTLHPFIMFMSWVEKVAYKNADHIIALMPDFEKHLEKVVARPPKVTWIPNGYQIPSPSAVNEPGGLRLPANKFMVAYTGAIGIANDLQYFIRSASLLKEYPEILLLVIGDGPEKENLKTIAGDHENILFLDKIKKEYIPELLAQVSVCFIAIPEREIYKYGVSPNKYNDYMYASKPILSASGMINDPVKIANCGIQVEPESEKAVAEGIIGLMRMDKTQREKLGKNGYQELITNKTYPTLAQKYLTVLDGLC